MFEVVLLVIGVVALSVFIDNLGGRRNSDYYNYLRDEYPLEYHAPEDPRDNLAYFIGRF